MSFLNILSFSLETSLIWYDFYFPIAAWSPFLIWLIIIAIFINSCIYLFIFHISLNLTAQNWTHFFKRSDQKRSEIPQHSLKILHFYTCNLRLEWLFLTFTWLDYLFIWFWFNFPFSPSFILLRNLINIHSRFSFKSLHKVLSLGTGWKTIPLKISVIH